MVDFAAILGVEVETSDLSRGDVAMQNFAASGERTEKRVKSAMHGVSAGVAGAAANVGAASQRMERQTRQAVNNLTYQLGDIAQMTAAGQSPFMLMMQQGEQTAGAMRDLSSTGRPLLSGLGMALRQLVNPITLLTFAAIGFGSAAIQAFRNSGEEAKTLADGMKDLNASFRDFDDAVESASISADTLVQKYGEASEAARALMLVQAENARMSLRDQVNTFFSDNSDPAGVLGSESGFYGVSPDSPFANVDRPFMAFTDDARAARDEIDALFSSVVQATFAIRTAVSLEEQIAAAEQMLEAYSAAADFEGGRSAAEAEYIDALSSVLLKLYEQAELGESITETIRERIAAEREQEFEELRLDAIRLYYDYAQRDLELLNERAAGVQAIRDATQSQMTLLEGQLQLSQLALQYGEESEQVKAKEISLARDQFIAEQMLLGVKGNNLQAVLDIYDRNVQVTGELEESKIQAEELEDALKRAASAMNSLNSFSLGLDKSLATAVAQVDALRSGQDAAIAGRIAGLRVDAAVAAQKALEGGVDPFVVRNTTAINNATISQLEQLQLEQKALEDAARSAGRGAAEGAREGERAAERLADIIQELEFGADPLARYNHQLGVLDGYMRSGLSEAAYSKEVQRLNDELASSIPMVDDLSQAFGDFVSRGFKDFEGFARSVFQSFQSLLSSMIATAARNRILISLGVGGAGGAATSAAASAAGSGLMGGVGALGGLGTFASSIGTGLSVVGSGFAAGGLSGAATATAGAISGGLGAGGAMGLGTALGAAIPVIGAVALVFGALRKTTKELDNGLNVTVDGLDVAAETFRTIETSRFFGLSRRTSTQIGAADPVIAMAVGEMQTGIMRTAELLGIGSEVFDNFAYDFRLSLQGLSQEAAAQKVAEEIEKLGDAFASMIPHIADVNELMAVSSQRYDLETRLLQLQGDTLALRQRELATVHEYNRAILEEIFALEDAQSAAAEAAKAEDARQSSIERTMDLFRSPLELDSERFSDRFSATIQAAEDRRSRVMKEADDAQLTELKLMRLALERLAKETRDARLYGETV